MSEFRVLHKIHLGTANTYLEKGDVITYQGRSLTRGDTSLDLPPAFLDGAIKKGWIVPTTSDTTEYSPQPAGVEVRSAVSQGNTRDMIDMASVQEEDREVTATKIASVKEPAQRNDSDAQVVGRLKSPKTGPVEIGRDDRRVVQQLDNKTAVEVEKVARPVATGDVQEARSGSELTDLLPSAASSDRPEPGVFDETKNQTPNNPYKIALQALSEDILRAIASQNTSDLQKSLDKLSKAGLIDSSKVVDGGFTWDMTRHWKTRLRDIQDNYMDNFDALRTISQIESSNAVLNLVRPRLAELGE